MADEGPAKPDSGTWNPIVASAPRICPWCSVQLGPSPPDRCPSCGAGLVEDPEAAVPGVTTVDPEAVRRAATWERVRKRATLRGFLEPDRDETAESGVRPSSIEALAPPSAELRQEMSRLREELEAAAEREARDLEAFHVEAAAAMADEEAKGATDAGAAARVETAPPATAPDPGTS
jgi:hypothetical protein